MEGYSVAKVSLNYSICAFKTAKLKKRKAKSRISADNRNDHSPTNMANHGVANYQKSVQHESVKIAPPSTKVSLQCDLCGFRTALLRRSKAQQRWYNHRYSHIVNIDQFQFSVKDYNNMEEEDQEDIFEEVSENTGDEPNCVIVTGDEPWMANCGLMEGELPWPGEDLSVVTTSNSSQANGDTPFLKR